MNLNLQQLNKEQKLVVKHGEGPLLIVAGAGTGKTTVITYRLAHLIKQKKAKPDEILALTFTDKAAEEMEERIDKLLPYGYVDLWVSTFHSFCKRILQEHGLDIGISTDFKLLDSTAAWLLIRQNLDKFDLDYYQPLGNPTKFIHALIAHFSRCKDQAIYPQDYLKYGGQDYEKHEKRKKGEKKQENKENEEEKKRIQEVAHAYHVYQNLLLENNLLDFGDLINYCLKLFQKRPKILKRYREKFKYILVDEFQDTNWTQYQLVKLLAAPKNNLTVTGDDDQAIYRFRGASFGNIVQFRKDFTNAKETILIQNYRSTQDILDLAYKFIKQNNPNRLEYIDKLDKKLRAFKKGKGIIKHLHFKNSEQENRGVVNKIIKFLKQDKKANLNDFAILVRANNQANVFARALERANLPYQFLALRGLYSKPVILDIISYFKLLDNYHESPAAFRILSLAFLQIPPEDIAKITQYSRRKTKSIYQTLQEPSLIPGLSKKTGEKINYLLAVVKKHTKLAEQKNVSEVFIAFLKDSGYLEYLTKNSERATAKARESLNYINQFYDRIKGFEESNLDTRLKTFMQELDLELESGEQGKLNFDIEQGPDMIRLMTVHSAKGLEFKYVFLVNLVDKRFPTIERKEPIEIPAELIKDIIPKGDIHLQEERRLFYVGVTRAKKGVFFTSAEDYGGLRKKKLSRFLQELGFSALTLKLKLQTAPAEIVTTELATNHLDISYRGWSLPSHFSFTQLRAFENCPYQYKFAHILKVPVRGKATFSYGKTMHNTLEQFIKQLCVLEGRTKRIGFRKLLEIYEKEWIDDWYDNEKQKKDYFEAGKKALKLFYNDFKKIKPEILLINEQPAVEQNFNLKIGGEKFIGKIDRIDKIKEGEAAFDAVELIDYKTGTMKEKFDRPDKEQLLIYQMAAKEVFNLEPIKLSYYYLDKGEKKSFLGAEQDIEKQKQKIIEQIKQIKKSDFSPTPGWQCKYCDFKDICEYAEK